MSSNVLEPNFEHATIGILLLILMIDFSFTMILLIQFIIVNKKNISKYRILSKILQFLSIFTFIVSTILCGLDATHFYLCNVF